MLAIDAGYHIAKSVKKGGKILPTDAAGTQWAAGTKPPSERTWHPFLPVPSPAIRGHPSKLLNRNEASTRAFVLGKLIGLSEAAAMSFDHIPIIDFSAAQSSDPVARKKLAEEVREVCVTIGFFYGAFSLARPAGG